MPIATKVQIMGLRGPEPLIEIFAIDGTDLEISIKGIVRSAERAQIYEEIDEMSSLRDVTVRGERVPVTEDDITAACWASHCVRSPLLTAVEWLLVGASHPDLLAAVGLRCLVCSRLVKDAEIPHGIAGAALSLSGDNIDPFEPSPFSSA